MRYITNEFDRNQLNFMPISFDEMIDANNPVRVIEGTDIAHNLQTAVDGKII